MRRQPIIKIKTLSVVLLLSLGLLLLNSCVSKKYSPAEIESARSGIAAIVEKRTNRILEDFYTPVEGEFHSVTVSISAIGRVEGFKMNELTDNTNYSAIRHALMEVHPFKGYRKLPRGMYAQGLQNIDVQLQRVSEFEPRMQLRSYLDDEEAEDDAPEDPCKEAIKLERNEVRNDEHIRCTFEANWDDLFSIYEKYRNHNYELKGVVRMNLEITGEGELTASLLHETLDNPALVNEVMRRVNEIKFTKEWGDRENFVTEYTLKFKWED